MTNMTTREVGAEPVCTWRVSAQGSTWTTVEVGGRAVGVTGWAEWAHPRGDVLHLRGGEGMRARTRNRKEHDMTSITAMQDMRRWAPSTNQITTAKALLRGMAGDCEVVVPIALHNKDLGVWTEAVDVDPIEGVYIVTHGVSRLHTGAVDWRMAVETAEEIARTNSRAGTGSYACIDCDGNYAVFEAR